MKRVSNAAVVAEELESLETCFSILNRKKGMLIASFACFVAKMSYNTSTVIFGYCS